MLKFSLNIAIVLKLVVLSFFSKYCFASLEINPSIGVSESYVVSKIAAESRSDKEFITTAQPGVAANYSGKRFSVLSDYRLTNRSRLSEKKYYDVSHQYNVKSSLGLLRDRIRLGATYNFGQRLNNPLGALNFDNRITGRNRVNRSSSRFEATWKQPISRIALGEMRYSLAQTDSASETLSQTRVDDIFLSLTNGIWFKRLFWEMVYSGIKYDNVSRSIPMSQSLTSLLGYRVLSSLTFSLTGGYERNPRFSSARQNQLQGYVVIAATSWQVSRKVLLSGTYGQRSFGESYGASLQIQPSNRLNLLASIAKTVIGSTFRGELNHRLRRANWFIRYNERLVSLAIPVAEQAPQFFVDETGASVFSTDDESFADITFPIVQNGFFIRRVFTLGSQLTGRKNTLQFSINHSTREFEELDIEDKGYGGNASWSLSLGRRGLFALSADKRRTSFGNATRSADILRLRVRYSHALGRQVNISGLYYYLERKASGAATSQLQHVARIELNATY